MLSLLCLVILLAIMDFRLSIEYRRNGCLVRRDFVELEDYGKQLFYLGSYLSRLSERPLNDEKIIITCERSLL